MENLAEKYPEQTQGLRDEFMRFAEEFDEYGIFDEGNIDDIESRSRDGFIPFTNGGVRCMVLSDLRTADGQIGAGFEEQTLRPYIDSSYNDAAYDFIMAEDELETLREEVSTDDAADKLYTFFSDAETEFNTAEALQISIPGIYRPRFWETPAGELQEKWHEYLSEYLSEGGEFWYVIGAHYFAPENSRNRSGEDELHIYAGINTDFTYGRDKGLNASYAVDVTVAELIADGELLEKIVDDAIASITADPESIEVAA